MVSAGDLDEDMVNDSAESGDHFSGSITLTTCHR